MDLAFFVKKAVQKELNAFSSKKRNAKDLEEEDLHLLEGSDLADFNYGDLENLSLSDAEEFKDTEESPLTMNEGQARMIKTIATASMNVCINYNSDSDESDSV